MICGPNASVTHEEDQAPTRQHSTILSCHHEGSANINHGVATNIASIYPTAADYIYNKGK
jgi:hypothetical protein